MDIPHLLIATPSFNGQFPAQYVQSIIGTTNLMQANDVRVNWTACANNSLLPMARNTLVASALTATDWTHLLLIDADIEWRPEDVLRLLARDLPFVAGLYACKTDDAALEYVPLPGKRPDPATGLLEVDAVGCGFVLLRRHVFLRLIEAYPESRITRTEGVYDAGSLPWVHDWFPLGFQDGVYTSEDYAFCRRWRATGGQVWADLNVQLVHHGHRGYAIDPMRLLNQVPPVIRTNRSKRHRGKAAARQLAMRP